jgi:hypothetical protein
LHVFIGVLLTVIVLLTRVLIAAVDLQKHGNTDLGSG